MVDKKSQNKKSDVSTDKIGVVDFIQTLKNYNKTNYSFNNTKINFSNLFDYYFYTIVYQTKFILEN